MQIVTGAGPDDAVTATSAIIPVMAKTSHTTTSNLSFAWTGDPNPTGPDPGARRCSLRSPIFSRTDSPCPYMRSTRSPFSRRTAPWGTRLSRCNTPRPATQLSKRSSSAQRETDCLRRSLEICRIYVKTERCELPCLPRAGGNEQIAFQHRNTAMNICAEKTFLGIYLKDICEMVCVNSCADVAV